MPKEPEKLGDVNLARPLAFLGDSITTDHISPAGSIKADSPAGRYLIEHQVRPADFNSYGAHRGHHEVMMRGTFANNVRIKRSRARWPCSLPNPIGRHDVRYLKRGRRLERVEGQGRQRWLIFHASQSAADPPAWRSEWQ
jgi:hypothetical protein